MSSHIADQPADSSVAPPGAGAQRDSSPVAKVEIVTESVEAEAEAKAPEIPRDKQDYRGVGVFPEQQETVITKKPPLSGKSSPVAPHTALSATTPTELGRVLEGTDLGHFRLEEFVGGGGMGAVFRAHDTKLGRTVAVKVLSRDRTDPDTLRRFENEAQSAARLDHENIARVHYVGEDKGLHYIVFEFIEGINIRDLVEQKGPLSIVEAVSFVLQVAEALEHASERNVVHRDIKPSNVLITSEGHAKLVDMGLARLRHMESESGDLTASGVTLGTFDYISPEQARDPRIADVRSDLYSLGCTFYFMLTGRPPFPNGTVLQKLLSHSSEEPSDPRHVRPDLDESLVKIITKLLAKQPDQRHQQPSELIGELLLLADRLNLTGIAQNGTIWAAQRKTRFSQLERVLPWLLPVVALFALVFALDRWWTAPQSPGIAEQSPELQPAVLPPSVDSDGGPGEAGEASGDETRPGTSQDRVDDNSASGDDDSSIPPSSPSEAGPSTAGAQDTPAAATTLPKPLDTPGASPMPLPKLPPKPLDDVPTAAGDNGQTGNGAAQTPTASPDAAGVANQGTGTADTPNAQLPRIIVGAPDTPIPPGGKVLSSLASACMEAASLGVETIELHFNEMREERPFDIASERLTIRNGEGFSPTVVFRPSFEDLSTDRRMIRVRGGRLTWQGVHLRMELPPEFADKWSLFYLEQIESLDVGDSVVTISNVGDDGTQLQDRVAFFELCHSAIPPIPLDDQNEELPIPPHVGLTSCVVRGQAALVWAAEAMPFRIVCRQCLLVLSDRLIDIGGARREPNLKDGPIDVVLKNVTAVLNRGMCRLSSTEEAPYLLDLVTDCKDSILLVPVPNAALIERRGVSDIAELEKRLYVRGRDNFYLGSMALLRINPAGDPSEYVDFGFEKRSEPWYQEQSPRFSLMWKSVPPAGVPEDRQTPADYLLDDSEQNPAIYGGGETRAGVDPSILPGVPDNAGQQGSTT